VEAFHVNAPAVDMVPQLTLMRKSPQWQTTSFSEVSGSHSDDYELHFHTNAVDSSDYVLLSKELVKVRQNVVSAQFQLLPGHFAG
jgi:hypothetical protein